MSLMIFLKNTSFLWGCDAAFRKFLSFVRGQYASLYQILYLPFASWRVISEYHDSSRGPFPDVRVSGEPAFRQRPQ